LRAGRGGAGDGVAARRDGVELGRPDQPRQIHGGPAAALRALPGATWWSGGRPRPHAAASAALKVLWTTHVCRAANGQGAPGGSVAAWEVPNRHPAPYGPPSPPH